MEKRLKKIGLALVAVGLSMVLLLTAGVPVCGAGPDEKVVNFGAHAVFTGGVSDIAPGFRGMFDYVKYVNDRDLLKGVKIDFTWEDTGQAPMVRPVVLHRRFKAAGGLVEFTALVDVCELLAPTLKRDEVVMISAGPASYRVFTKPMYVVSTLSCGQDFALCGVKWFIDNWTEKRRPRIGIINWDHSTGWYAADGISDGAEKYGYEFVGSESVPFVGTLDTSTEWLRLAAKKPDLIFSAACGSSLTVMIKDSARLGIQEKRITILDSGECFEDAMPIVGKDAEGWYASRWLPNPLHADAPGMKEVYEIAKTYRGWGPEKIRSLYILGIMMAKVAVEGVRLAIEKVGFNNLSGRAIRDSLFSFEDVDIGLMPPITMSDERPFWVSQLTIEQVQEGRLRTIAKDLPVPLGEQWLPTWVEEFKHK